MPEAKVGEVEGKELFIFLKKSKILNTQEEERTILSDVGPRDEKTLVIVEDSTGEVWYMSHGCL